jgi:hypothetical protein
MALGCLIRIWTMMEAARLYRKTIHMLKLAMIRMRMTWACLDGKWRNAIPVSGR